MIKTARLITGPWIIAIALLSAVALRAAESGATAWVQRYSHPTPGYSAARDVVTDHAGNVIVAGGANDNATGGDFLVIKYSGAGVPLWTNRYDGLGSSGESATSVAVDASDNVFVAGTCCIVENDEGDYAIIKYSSAGVPLWTNRYDGPAHSDDLIHAIAVDTSGNVFVTGYSTGIGSSYDYATLAYSGAGVPLWTNRFNGPGNGYDEAFALAVDSAGNVFVTGSSTRLNGDEDGLTVAYSGAGVPLWTNDFGGGAIAVDASGKVFVAGGAERPAGSHLSDYQTVAFSGTGALLWVNYYDGTGNENDYAQDVAVDATGNVFVTGLSKGLNSNFDFATIKYSGVGVPLWTNRYNGTANDYDNAGSLAVDSSGNVVVSGYSGPPGSYHYVTIKYTSAGSASWTREFTGAVSPEAVAVDGGGNVFVTGSGYITVAYSSTGTLLWTNRFTELGSRNDDPQAVAVDHQGNVFVTGRSESSTSSYSAEDFATVAYSSTGTPLWTNRYNGPGDWQDWARAIGVDDSGNVFVTGWSSSMSCCSEEMVTIKYSGAGVPLWTNRYSAPSKRNNEPTALAVDGNGDVIVAATSENGSHDYDYTTVKYSSTGALLWARFYNGPANGQDHVSAVAVDSSGNVFVTGTSSGGSTADDYLTIKYSAAGVPQWTNRYDGPANGEDKVHALKVDNSGNVIVTGDSVGSSGFGDYTTIKYSNAGVPLWTNRYAGDNIVSLSHNAPSAALAVDSSRNVFVTGTPKQGLTTAEIVTLKYSEAGVPLWTNSSSGYAGAIAADAGGNAFVVGTLRAPDYSSALVMLKYSGDGVPLWTNRFRGPGDTTQLEYKSCLAIAPDGSPLVAAQSNRGQAYDYLTIKYVSVPMLEIRRYEASLRLSWPSSFSDFTLQNADDFGTTNWSNVPGPVSDDGVNRAITVDPPTGSRFYRLSRP